MDREGNKMKEKYIKNETNKIHFKKSLIFSIVILMLICLPLTNLASVFSTENDKNLNNTLHTSESVSWTANGAAISLASSEQWYPNVISDGTGGAFITWHDDRNSGITGSDIYAQKINSAGIAEWGANGTLICNALGDQSNPQLISDGAGGVIITWSDERMGASVDDIYAQKVNSAGITQWEDNGTLICNADYYQFEQRIIGDGMGGAIIIWQDMRTFPTTFSDIYTQRIDSAGITQWDDNGTLICNVIDYQRSPQLVSDGAGGAIITWEDNRDSGTTGFDIYAQRIDSAGITQWDDNGTLICDENNSQLDPQLVSDGAGGAIVTWQDSRFGVNDIYAQKVNSGGSVQWDTHWTLVCNATGRQFSPQIVNDGMGGAIITWHDERVATDQDDIYAQKKNSIGISQWDDNGTLICDANSDQLHPQLVSDGAGGAIITWQDSRFGVNDIYAQKINSVGNTQWNDDGTLICNAINDQWYPQITSDNIGGAIIVWQDERVATDQGDIYAQKIDSDELSIIINSPINLATFSSTSGLFNVTVNGFWIHTIWYTINEGPINTIWYTMNGGLTQSFTVITAVEVTKWAAFADNTLVNVTFYVNETSGNQASSSVEVYIDKTTSGGGDNIPGFDLVTISVISVIAIIILAKAHERKTKRIQK